MEIDGLKTTFPLGWPFFGAMLVLGNVDDHFDWK